MTEASQGCHAAVPSILTFGFGYSLDTMLLVDIAAKGHGCFSYIPDSGFVGPVLIHAIANLSTTAGTLARLNLEGAGDTELRVIGGDAADVETSGPAALSVNLDSIHLGQPRTLLLAVKPTAGHALSALEQEELVHAALCYKDARGEQRKVVGSVAASSTRRPAAASPAAAGWREAALRLEFVRLLSSLVPAGAHFTLAAKQAAVQAFIEEHQEAHAGHGILVDAEGQVRARACRCVCARAPVCSQTCGAAVEAPRARPFLLFFVPHPCSAGRVPGQAGSIARGLVDAVGPQLRVLAAECPPATTVQQLQGQGRRRLWRPGL